MRKLTILMLAFASLAAVGTAMAQPYNPQPVPQIVKNAR